MPTRHVPTTHTHKITAEWISLWQGSSAHSWWPPDIHSLTLVRTIGDRGLGRRFGKISEMGGVKVSSLVIFDLPFQGAV